MDDSTRRQLARRAAHERKTEKASQHDGELTDLGERVEIAIRTRDVAVRRAERVAGELLFALTRRHGLSMENALLWCSNIVSRADGLRLRRIYERSNMSR